MRLSKWHRAGIAAMAAVLALIVVRATVAPATAAPRVVADPPTPTERGVERFRLANGLKVILRPMPASRDVALVVAYAIGEDHDPEGRSGLAHATEHLYVTAVAGDQAARTADEWMRRYPAGSNAQTGARETVIAAVFPKDRLDRELADASARMRGPRVTAADLDRERPRLLAEVANMFERFPALAALNNARERARPMPRGGRHGGRPEHLRAITVDEIRTRLDRYYKPRNAVLALAGGFDAAAARKAIEARFAAIPAGEAVPPPGEPGAPRFVVQAVPGRPAPESSDREPTACLAYPAPRPDGDLFAPFLILVARLSAEMGWPGGPGSAGPSVVYAPLDDGSVVSISAAIGRGEAPDQAVRRIEAFVARAVGRPLEPGEPAGAVRHFGMLMGSSGGLGVILGRDPYGVAFSLARRDQLGVDPARLERALRAVNDRDLKRAAASIFAPTRHAGAYTGPDR